MPQHGDLAFQGLDSVGLCDAHLRQGAVVEHGHGALQVSGRSLDESSEGDFGLGDPVLVDLVIGVEVFLL